MDSSKETVDAFVDLLLSSKEMQSRIAQGESPFDLALEHGINLENLDSSSNETDESTVDVQIGLSELQSVAGGSSNSQMLSSLQTRIDSRLGNLNPRGTANYLDLVKPRGNSGYLDLIKPR